MPLRRILVLAAFLLTAGCSPDQHHDPDAVLIQTLHDQRATFEQLLAMIQQDRGLQRVDYNWVLPDPPPISAERLSEYRRLLQSVGCVRGFTHISPEGVTFIASANGMVTGGSGKGYYYSEVPPSPLVPSLDEYQTKRQGAYVVYRHIEGNWYLYYDFDD